MPDTIVQHTQSNTEVYRALSLEVREYSKDKRGKGLDEVWEVSRASSGTLEVVTVKTVAFFLSRMATTEDSEQRQN